MKMNNLNVLLYYIIYVYNQKYNLIIIYIYKFDKKKDVESCRQI